MFDQLVKRKGVFGDVLQELLEEKKYSFGEPWQLTSESLSAVVPILQNTTGNRGYLVAQEIPKDKISIVDSGKIGKARAQRRYMNSLRLLTNAYADNLVANLREMNEFNQRIDDVLSKLPADLENQVGVVMIDSKGVYGLETFNHPDSWRAFSKSIVRNYADVLAKERVGQGLFALKVEKIPEAIKGFLRKAEGLSENSVFKNEISETCALSGELTGEYSTLRHDLIHLILKRNTAVSN